VESSSRASSNSDRVWSVEWNHLCYVGHHLSFISTIFMIYACFSLIYRSFQTQITYISHEIHRHALNFWLSHQLSLDKFSRSSPSPIPLPTTMAGKKAVYSPGYKTSHLTSYLATAHQLDFNNSKSYARHWVVWCGEVWGCLRGVS
jgi:hypothetical protein